MRGVKRFYTSGAKQETILLCGKHEGQRRRNEQTLIEVTPGEEEKMSAFAVETCCTDCESPRVERVMRRLRA